MADTNTNTSATCGNSSSSNSNQATSSIAPGGLNPEASSSGSAQAVDRLKSMYPNVNENETPLPRIWKRVDKHYLIRLSPNNLRVQYKGAGTQATSVRTAHPIPSTCGIYYFEVKIISTGQHGYIAIGLTSPSFNMKRLPGLDMQSFGFHGDDGYVYSSCDLGFKYGPTFNAGDIIGCCWNMVSNTVFFTMNGKDMGTAFRNLPKNLYPAVGMQTKGEEIEVNFGQQPFKFTKIESTMEEMRSDMMSSIQNFSLSSPPEDSKNVMKKLVSAYLVHYGYSATAETFSQATGQNLGEDIASIKTRKQILILIMDGHVSEAIEMTQRLYPGVLENNKNLWFMLQCRQFIEMTIKVAETLTATTTAIGTTATETTTATTTAIVPIAETATETTTARIETTATETTTTTITTGPTTTAMVTTATETETTPTTITTAPTTTATTYDQKCRPVTVINAKSDVENQANSSENSFDSDDGPTTSKRIRTNNKDIARDERSETFNFSAGNACASGSTDNSKNANQKPNAPASTLSPNQSISLERLLGLCKELSFTGEQLEKENKLSDEERKLMQDSISSLAYTDPWKSPLASQLCPSKRESVSRALNSAILEKLNKDRLPPLELCVAQAGELLKVMSQAGLGESAYAHISEVFPKEAANKKK